MLVSLIPWILYALAWVCTLVAVQHGAPLFFMLMYFVVIFNGGIQGLWAALGHLAFPKQTAAKIGWQSNGFQVEIGCANLAIGISGILTFFYPAWAAALSMFIVIYYGGCAYNHIKERLVDKNNAPCNSGPMLYSTIATVITLAICLLFELTNF